MNILLQGFLDRNFGDDIMLLIVADQLREHKFYIREARKELLIPFLHADNIFDLDDAPDIVPEVALRVTGSGFVIAGKMDIFFFLLNKLTAIGHNKQPKAIIGCNVGPYANRFAQWLSVTDMRQYALISVRDSFSLRFVENHIKKARVMLFPDILFSLPRQWIPALTNEGCLGISAYRRESKNNLAIYRKQAQIADSYIRRTGKKVLLFAFDTERENDLCAAYTIRRFAEKKDWIEIIPHDDNGSRVLHGMARCARFLSVRFHSCVLAIRMNIPFVPLIYSDKTSNMLDDLGYQGCRYSLTDFDPDMVAASLETAAAFPLDPKISEAAKGHVNTLKELFLNGN